MSTGLRPPVALTVAGSDSGGGAGIQADLRTFAFHRVHGTSALTCITAQNTLGVDRVDALAPEAVTAQIGAVAGDIGVDAAKTGMLLNAPIMVAAAEALVRHGVERLVVDPVMVSRAGARLVDAEAEATIAERLVPIAAILTPNRHEARILADMDVETRADMEEAARRIHARGARAVLVKGGAMEGALRAVDVLFDGSSTEVLETECVDTADTHGTGCSLSAAIAANLALGKSLDAAVRDAKGYVTEGLRRALRIGGGQGPICHYHALL